MTSTPETSSADAPPLTGRLRGRRGRGGGPSVRPRTLSRRRALTGVLLSLPAVVVLVVLVLVPAIRTVLYSFQDVPASGRGPTPFVGFDHYERVLTADAFWHSVEVTLIFAFAFVVLSTTIGLGQAVLLNKTFVGRAFARAALILPWATPWLVIGIIWKWYLDPDVGALPSLLGPTGLGDSESPFLASPNSALFFAVLSATWRQAALSGLILLAGLQAVPSQLVEAARVDGASSWTVFRNVVMPALRPVMVGVIILNSLYACLQFDVVFVMTGGGPGDATQLISILLYRQLFVFNDFGVGSVVAVFLSLGAVLFAAVMTLPQLVLLRRERPDR